MALIWRSLFLGFNLFLTLSLFSCGSETALRKKPVPVQGINLEEKDLTWRGGTIGGALGIPVKGKATEIIDRATREGAKEGLPVVYISLDGFQRVEVHPVKEKAEDHCRLLHLEVYQEGTLVRGEEKDVCW
jgi:hypothetical protein